MTWTNTTSTIKGITGNEEWSDLVINPGNDKNLYAADGTSGGGDALASIFVPRP